MACPLIGKTEKEKVGDRPAKLLLREKELKTARARDKIQRRHFFVVGKRHENFVAAGSYRVF